VAVLLNLGNIPDEVARDFDFKEDFSDDIKDDMQKFKEKFKRDKGVTWEFMNDHLIERYYAFKRHRDSLKEQLNSNSQRGVREVEMSAIN
jgi:hypothetical protein